MSNINNRTLFSVIDSAVKSGEKVSAKVRAILAADDRDDQFRAFGVELMRKLPVVNEDTDSGRKRDRNAETRNAYLRALRMALSRQGKVDGCRYLFKKIEGEFQLIVEQEQAKEASEGAEQEQGSEQAGVIDPDSDEADSLWSAVDLVLANLSNPAVLSAIKTGLQQMAQNGGKQ